MISILDARNSPAALDSGGSRTGAAPRPDTAPAFAAELRACQAELAACQEDRRLERAATRRLLNAAKVLIVALDSDGRVTLINQYACTVVGWTEEYLIGRDWIETCLPPRIREPIRAVFRDALAGDEGLVVSPILTEAGDERVIEWHSVVLLNDAGEPAGMICSGRDVTQYLVAEKARRVAEDRMEFALLNANIGVWDQNADGHVEWSVILESQYGLEPGAFERTFDAFITRVHPDDRRSVMETIGAAAKTGGKFTIEHRVIHSDGSVRWLRGTGWFHLDVLGNPVRAIGISQDITAARSLQSQYLHAQKMEAVGRLASGVAHDFNNLLTVITGTCEFLASRLEPETEQARDAAEIMKAALRAAGLTQQLLAFSRQQVLRSLPIMPNELITGMQPMIERLISEDIRVKVDLDPDVREFLGDRGQLEQVIMNLVVNAKDAMPHGGSLLIETGERRLKNSPFHHERVVEGDYVMLAVTDTGTGMTEETQKRLFEPFFTTKKVGEGTGLGLSTCYGIVRQSHGYIWVYSELGIGTTFKVFLPCAQAPSGDARDPTAAPLSERGSENVLLVEDEFSVRELARRILSKAGYRVLAAANGDEAETIFHEHSSEIDIVVTDVVMPGCGGPELMARLAKIAPGLPVLYMSGYTARSVARRVGLDRGSPFLQKPFLSGDLLQKVRAALAHASIQRAGAA